MKLDELKRHLRRGKVYRRSDLAKWSKAVDRHLDQLVKDGTLQKLCQGMYYYPKVTAFGIVPPDEDTLVRNFLNDDRYLITSPNAYNRLGVGTTQLYNERTVYNFKRCGEFTFGNRKFKFQMKHDFPRKVTEEFLLVDLVNNLSSLAEDQQEVLRNTLSKATHMDAGKLKRSLSRFGSAKAKKLLEPVLQVKKEGHAA